MSLMQLTKTTSLIDDTESEFHSKPFPQKMPRPEDVFVGVDVGTGSVRAGLVSHDGRVLKTSSEDIKVC